jgi:hypothetical protein
VPDWTEELTPEEREAWDEFVDHFRRTTLGGMQASAMVASFVPGRDEFDVRFATELGAAVLLDKPVLAVVMPGAPVPGKLRLVADVIVHADVDTEEGRREVARALKELGESIEDGPA